MKYSKMIWLSIGVAVLLLAGLVVGVYASYIKDTGSVSNFFRPAESVKPDIKETFTDGVKSDVYFEVGKTEYPVYVRASILITWKRKYESPVSDDTESESQAPDDTEGESQVSDEKEDDIVYFTKPVEAKPDGAGGYTGDYLMDLNSADWELRSDGYYYYVKENGELKAVESEGKTSNLIRSIRQVNDHAPEGYVLSVEILVQTIQAVGYTDETEDQSEIPAWEDAWNATAIADDDKNKP